MASESEPWHLSKNVPITFILAIIVQSAGIVWFVSGLEANVNTNVRDIARHEIRMAEIEKTQQAMAVLNARIDENIKAIREMMETSRSTATGR